MLEEARKGAPKARLAAFAAAGTGVAVRPALVTPVRAIPATLPEFRRMFSAGACKGRLLLVEDLDDIRELLGCLLKHKGYFVRAAGNGAECLRLAKTMRPDIILLNYLMPVMDGLTALRQLKMDPVISYLKVIMYSAVGGDSPFWTAAMEAGAVDCLHTPFDAETLLIAIERGLRSH